MYTFCFKNNINSLFKNKFIALKTQIHCFKNTNSPLMQRIYVFMMEGLHGVSERAALLFEPIKINSQFTFGVTFKCKNILISLKSLFVDF